MSSGDWMRSSIAASLLPQCAINVSLSEARGRARLAYCVSQVAGGGTQTIGIRRIPSRAWVHFGAVKQSLAIARSLAISVARDEKPHARLSNSLLHHLR